VARASRTALTIPGGRHPGRVVGRHPLALEIVVEHLRCGDDRDPLTVLLDRVGLEGAVAVGADADQRQSRARVGGERLLQPLAPAVEAVVVGHRRDRHAGRSQRRERARRRREGELLRLSGRTAAVVGDRRLEVDHRDVGALQQLLQRLQGGLRIGRKPRLQPLLEVHVAAEGERHRSAAAERIAPVGRRRPAVTAARTAAAAQRDDERDQRERGGDEAEGDRGL
jgi:hypothetical protein